LGGHGVDIGHTGLLREPLTPPFELQPASRDSQSRATALN
jgi:hypothetical protein